MNYLTKSSFLAMLYILLMTIAFTRNIGNLIIDTKVQFSVSLFWILVSISKILINNINGIIPKSRHCFLFLLIFLLPHIIFHCYSIILMLFGVITWKFFNLNTTAYIPILMSISALFLFKKKAFSLTVYAIIISWLLSVFSSIYVWGPDVVKGAIIQAYFYDEAWQLGYGINHLEFHDISLSIGYIFIYLMFRKSFSVSDKIIFAFLILIGFISLKKIVLLGILAVLFYYLFLKIFLRKIKFQFIIFSGYIIILVCIAFVFDLYITKLFYVFIDEFNINTMNRTVFYKMITDLSEFSVFFEGLGRNTVAILFQKELYWDQFDLSKIGAVHCDILKMYVENGFFLFLFWLWFKIIFITKIFKEKFNINASIIYFLSILYTFILYFTDNTEVYFTCNVLFILLVTHYVNYGTVQKINCGIK